MWQKKKKERDGKPGETALEHCQQHRDSVAKLERDKLKLEKRLGKVTTGARVFFTIVCVLAFEMCSSDICQSLRTTTFS